MSPLARYVLILVLFFLMTHPARADDTLTVKVEKWAGDVHPTTVVTLEGIIVVNQVYETLLTLGPGSRVLPNLVKSWDFDREKNQFRFQLEPGLKFSDGTLLTSADVKRTFEAIIKSGRFKNFDKILGAAAYREGQTKDVAGFQTLSKTEFAIRASA